MPSSLHNRLHAHLRDQQKGAATLAIDAIDLLSEHAITNLNTPDYRSTVKQTCQEIHSAHLCMANIQNALHWWEVYLLSSPLKSYEIIEAQQRFKEQLKKTQRQAVEKAIPLILSASSVASCSNSSTVVLALSRAIELGYTAPIWLYYDCKKSKQLAELMQSSINPRPKQIELVRKKPTLIDDQSLILVGADAVSPQGIVSGSPAQKLLDLWSSTSCCIIAETIKYTSTSIPIDGFDLLDHKRVKYIISEYGIEAKVTNSSIRRQHLHWLNLLK